MGIEKKMISPQTEDRIERAKSPKAEVEFSMGSDDDELEVSDNNGRLTDLTERKKALNHNVNVSQV